jgi:hypothetical protein
LGTAYLTTTSKVEGPEEPERWPSQYQEVHTTISVDRRKATEDLKRGAVVEGLTLVTSRSVGVR